MKRPSWIGMLAVVAPMLLAPGLAPAETGELLVDARWLEGRLASPGLRVIDMTAEPGDYEQGHIPGAVRLDVNDARVAVPAGGFRLPTADEMARLVARLGIGPDTHVVLYDDAGGLNAGRFFFTLDVFGHPKVSILDGGIQVWRRAGFPVARDRPSVAPTAYRPSLRPERVLSAEQVMAVLGDPTVALVDARSPGEYTGKDVRARRGGHIPGAVNLEWRENLRPDLTFKPIEELRAMYVAKGIVPDKRVVTYCQTQHRGAHAYFVLRLLGYDRIAGYDRSWAEWGSRDDLPLER